MARTSGLEKKKAPWHLRWFYGVMRKMFGKDLTPAKVRCVYLVSCGAGSRWKPLLVVSDLCHCAIFNWGESAPQHASAVRSE
jgi:hypothetical protein